MARGARIVLAGEGALPPQAMKQFVDWGGGARGHFLVVAFSTRHSDEVVARMRERLAERGVPAERVLAAPRFEEMAVDTFADLDEWPVGKRIDPIATASKALFLGQIAAATAVYFAGGDQNRHMAILADPDIATTLRTKLAEGVPFAGGSAGLHALTHPMIAGDATDETDDPYAVLLADGFGALPGVIADSHFLQRRRANRLKGALRKARDVAVGVGVDEGAALVVDGDVATAVGSSIVEVFVRSSRHVADFRNVTLEPGGRFDLRRKRRLLR